MCCNLKRAAAMLRQRCTLSFSFSSSAIMTWINLGDQDEITAGDLWRGKGGPTEDDDQLDKYFRIKSNRTLEARFFDRDEN